MELTINKRRQKSLLSKVLGPTKGGKVQIKDNAGWGKTKLTVVHMENNTIINNNTNINSVSHTTVNLLLPHPVYKKHNTSM